jgi:hypothetical protein
MQTDNHLSELAELVEITFGANQMMNFKDS